MMNSRRGMRRTVHDRSTRGEKRRDVWI